jgi:hypothetical protein
MPARAVEPAMCASQLQQVPDDLEGLLALACDGLHRGVDGIDLVVARRLAAAAVEIVLKNNLLGFGDSRQSP